MILLDVPIFARTVPSISGMEAIDGFKRRANFHRQRRLVLFDRQHIIGTIRDQLPSIAMTSPDKVGNARLNQRVKHASN
ncbi:hypothetical protein [Burkholderia lata]|uniref:hypothetical protein n=1 Tax=Burkholderia lata (strain ATCC 17760 / DSM 23089 / LMG 22485 / NCIMB 9086 / R18194 / 383) TaxID=482957 RepID=UPI0034A02233